MKYKYILLTLCMFGTISLYAEEKGLGSILQQAGTHKKILTEPKKKSVANSTRFVFKDEYDSNGLGVKDKDVTKGKSKSYDYENKPRFKFQFNDGSGNNNFVAGQRSPQTGASVGGGSMGGVSMGGGQGGGGRGGR
jgi:hypothetical protein